MPAPDPTQSRSFLPWAVRRGLPLLPADEANQRIVELTVEVMKLQAELDAYKMREAKP